MDTAVRDAGAQVARPRAASRISVAAPLLTEETWTYVRDCLDTTWISSSGAYITRFERMFAEFCGVGHAVACNNGTTALHLALACAGIGPGDEVILPDLTYIASANCVSYCGAVPVFVDNEVGTYNIDPGAIEARITARTKAILAVHLYGHPCDMDPIAEIARRHSLHVIEDAAEAHGARYKGRPVGSLGLCAAFSFFGNKIVTTGEGGMVVTDDAALAERLRLFRGQGMNPERRYWFDVIGFNYRMTNVAAAIGVAQMERVETALKARRRLAALYDEALRGIDGLILPHTEEWATHAYWMYTIRLNARSAIARDDLMRALDERGIETRPVFYPMHVLPPYARDGASYPGAIECSRNGINLPTHELLTRDDVERIARELRDLV